MTGYQSKKRMAQGKLNDDDDTQVYGDALTIAYQSGYYDGKKAALAEALAQPEQEPLTLDAISQLIDECEANEKKEFLVELVRAVEAAHGIKEENNGVT